MPYVLHLMAAFVVNGMFACSGDDTTPTPTPTPMPSPPPTTPAPNPHSDSATESGESIVNAVVTARFGIDGPEGNLIEVPGDAQPKPHVTVYWGTQKWAGDPVDITNACMSMAVWDGGKVDIGAKAPMPQPLGITLPAGTTTSSTCTEAFNLAFFTGNDPANGPFPPNKQWRLGFGGAVGPGLVGLLTEEELKDVKDLVGGTVLSNTLKFGGTPDIYFRVWEIDAKGDLVLQDGQPVPVAPNAIVDAKTGGPARGLYELTMPGLYPVAAR